MFLNVNRLELTVSNAVPFNDNRPESCIRYQFIGSSGISNGASCNKHNFNRSHIVPCSDYIIKNNEQRLVSRVWPVIR